MDKLKEQLAVVKQQSFWIMCVGILIVGVVSWYLSTKAIVEKQQSQLSDINTVFKSLDSLKQQNPEHPNAKTAEGMEQMGRLLSAEVAKGWQLQYDQQAKVLVWPPSFDEEFHAAVDKLRPIEVVPPPPTPFANDLPAHLRRLYRNYIEIDIPTLAKTIGAEWKATSAVIDPSGSGTTGYSSPSVPTPNYSTENTTGQPGTVVEDKSIVLWTPENQQHLLQTHFSFTARAEVPSTLDVLYAQEDLWVLQNIMDMIKKTNGDAEARHVAVIKQIDFVRIGKSAAGLAGVITPVGPVQGSSAYGTTGYPESGQPTTSAVQPPPVEGASPATTGYPQTGYGTTQQVNTDPAWGRYVDETYKPLDPVRLRGAYKSQDPKDALLAVAKRMPVRLRFKVDQRRLNVLLAECGNSRLPIEIRQVRVNRDPAAIGGDSTGGGYGGTGQTTYASPTEGRTGYGGNPYGGMQRNYGESGGMGGDCQGMVPGSATSDASVDGNVIDLELYGVVYIYNPVNKSQLGLEQPAGTVSTPAPAMPVSPVPASTSSSPSPVPPAAALMSVR